ncbi:MAG: hypothetical protein H0T46_36025 [Deltaproteobacteria bacterium]|nr:hypothetical protein [Deltaproteobacteria bacterium]
MSRAVVLLLLLLASCDSSSNKASSKPPPPRTPDPVVAKPVGPTVDPAGFDRSCTASTDCVVVKRAGCDPCACATEAIASRDMAKFDESLAKLQCPEPDLSVRCSPCQLFASACENGTCVAVPKF